MTETPKQSSQSPSAAGTPDAGTPAAASRQAGQHSAPPQPATQSGGEQSGVFGDGSTQEQQDQLIKEAEETNAAVKEFADAERDARNGG